MIKYFVSNTSCENWKHLNIFALPYNGKVMDLTLPQVTDIKKSEIYEFLAMMPRTNVQSLKSLEKKL